jgi:excisionase family DNA binding protein
MADLAYSVVQAAKKLGCSKNTVYAMVEENRIPHRWLTEHRVVIPVVALEKWLESSFETVEQTPRPVTRPFAKVQSINTVKHPALRPGCGGRKRKAISKEAI